VTIILTSYAFSKQNGKDELSDPTSLFKMVYVSEKTPETKIAKMRVLTAYTKLMIYYALPRDFYHETFGINYESLLVDLYKKQLLPKRDFIRLRKLELDMKQHEHQVVTLIEELIGKCGPAEDAFLKFHENLKVLKKMLQDDFLRFTYSPVMKIILVFSFIGCFSSFSKVNSLPDFLDSVTLSNNLFFFISYTCYYLGVYALDVFGKGNYFFNKIIKKKFEHKKVLHGNRNGYMEMCDQWLLGFNEGSGELRIVGEITGLMPGQPVFTFRNSATSSATEATPRLAN
jgi:hypothetical protein